MLTSLILYCSLLLSLKCTCTFLLFVYRYFLRRKLDLLSRYGKGSYALVTGGTDGIGQEFCRQLAGLGFNLVIVSRNIDKLQNTRNRILRESQSVDIVLVQADFSYSYEKQFFCLIEKQIAKYDISILINNVG